jgi:hypothetical protein
MAVISRPTSGSSGQNPAIAAIVTVLLVLIIYLATVTDDVASMVTDNQNKPSLRSSVVHKRQQLRKALHDLTTQKIPMRLLKLRERNEIVGERLGDIRAGTETVEEVLHGSKKAAMSMAEDSVSEPPMEFTEIKSFLEDWIKTLHETLVEAKHENCNGIWKTYHDLTVKTLYPWDREYLQRMPPRRDDGSIFLSLATYRDENCLNTVKGAFGKAKNPELLFVGIVQQNCHANCRSGVLEGGKMEVSSMTRARFSMLQICVVMLR